MSNFEELKVLTDDLLLSSSKKEIFASIIEGCDVSYDRTCDGYTTREDDDGTPWCRCYYGKEAFAREAKICFLREKLIKEFGVTPNFATWFLRETY